MAYESGFLDKLRAVANDHTNGSLDYDGFCKKARALYEFKRPHIKQSIQDAQSEKAFEACSRAAETSAAATDLLEEGFHLWFEYMAWEPPLQERENCEHSGVAEPASEKTAEQMAEETAEKELPDRRLIEEGLEKMKTANAMLNKSRDLFLDAAEEDPIQFFV